MRRLLVGVLALVMFMANALLVTSHEEDALASWSSCHGFVSSSIHELDDPPVSWPGYRAAHTVQATYYGGGNYGMVHRFYTKSHNFDPTWDYYYQQTFACKKV